MKQIQFSLICFFMAIASICYAQKKKVIKVRQLTTESNIVASDYDPPKTGESNAGFNQYSNNKVFTDGDVLLNKPIKDVNETEQINRDALVIYGSNGTVVSFDLQKQLVNWTYAEKDIKGSSDNQFSVDHATLYLPYTNGTVTALNINTGAVNWKDKIGFATDKNLLAGQNAVVDKGLLFIAARNNNVYAINKINGKMVWNYRLDFEYNIYPPLLLHEGVYFNNAPYVYKFEAQTGKAIWQRGFKKAMYAKMVTDGKRVYTTNESSTLFAVNPAGSSTIEWQFDLLDNQYGVDGNIILSNGVIYMAGKANPDSKASSIYAINAADGKQIWKTDLPKNRIEDLSLIDDQIYGYIKDHFFIIAIKDGNQILSVKPQEEPISNIIRESDDSVLYASKNGLVRYTKANNSFKLIPIAQLKTEDKDGKTTIQLVAKSN